MTREEAIQVLQTALTAPFIYGNYAEALDIAIEALSVVQCKDCKHQEHCEKTVAHKRGNDGFNVKWLETIEWCSRGERKGGDE